ncbi:MAG: hypothetical protein Kow0058_17620 [Roseovarius sp.]
MAVLWAPRHLAQEKTGHALEQDRPDALKKRRDRFEGQPDLDPDRLVLIDETCSATNMTRSHGRCRRAERLRMAFPHGERKTTAWTAGLRKIGIVAPTTLDGPINGDWFEACIRHLLIPALCPGDVVIVDNLSCHKRTSVREMTAAAGARLMFLPPYSPDFNPIEIAFAKRKALLQKAAAGTISCLCSTIGQIVDCFTPQERENYFAACGYNAD